MTPKEQREAETNQILELCSHLQTLFDTLNAAEKENDSGVLSVYLEILQQKEDEIGKIWGEKDGTVKEYIRQGAGDYSKLQTKFIKLGLV